LEAKTGERYRPHGPLVTYVTCFSVELFWYEIKTHNCKHMAKKCFGKCSKRAVIKMASQMNIATDNVMSQWF